MNDQWTDRLSEYLDGELDAAERQALEAHLAGCAACRATLADLRRVVARAQSLEDRAPEDDLWPEIHAGLTPGRARLTPGGARLTPGRRPGVISLTVGQLLAASIALVLVSGGAVWMALQPRDNGGSVAGTTTRSQSPQFSAVRADAWRLRTDVAVADLEEALTRNESQLDTATVRVVRQSLAVIDRAIAQAQRALRRDPGNAYLNLHLANTMRQKIELLRRANALAASD